MSVSRWRPQLGSSFDHRLYISYDNSTGAQLFQRLLTGRGWGRGKNTTPVSLCPSCRHILYADPQQTEPLLRAARNFHSPLVIFLRKQDSREEIIFQSQLSKMTNISYHISNLLEKMTSTDKDFRQDLCFPWIGGWAWGESQSHVLRCRVSPPIW